MCPVNVNRNLLQFITVAENWGQRVRSIFSEDITQSWDEQVSTAFLGINKDYWVGKVSNHFIVANPN